MKNKRFNVFPSAVEETFKLKAKKISPLVSLGRKDKIVAINKLETIILKNK